MNTPRLFDSNKRTVIHESRIPICREEDILAARGIGRELAQRMGFGLADQTRLATGISELARNVLQYAIHGDCTVRAYEEGPIAGLRVTMEDQGEGIKNIDAIFELGRGEHTGIGTGLPGVKRLMDTFSIISRPGLTQISIELYRRKGGMAR